MPISSKRALALVTTGMRHQNENARPAGRFVSIALWPSRYFSLVLAELAAGVIVDASLPLVAGASPPGLSIAAASVLGTGGTAPAELVASASAAAVDAAERWAGSSFDGVGALVVGIVGALVVMELRLSVSTSALEEAALRAESRFEERDLPSAFLGGALATLAFRGAGVESAVLVSRDGGSAARFPGFGAAPSAGTVLLSTLAGGAEAEGGTPD